MFRKGDFVCIMLENDDLIDIEIKLPEWEPGIQYKLCLSGRQPSKPLGLLRL